MGTEYPQPQPQSRPLERHRKWRDDLVIQLRMDDVPGDRIGEILLEVETHVHETGESPEEAFGPAKEYAKERATASGFTEVDEDDPDSTRLLLIGFGSFAGAGLYASGAIALGQGLGSFLGLPAWIITLIGAALLVALLVRLPEDLVRHPTTGAPLLGTSTLGRWIVGGLLALLGVGLYLLGGRLA